MRMKSCCRMGGSWRKKTKTKRAMMMNEIRWVFKGKLSAQSTSNSSETLVVTVHWISR